MTIYLQIIIINSVTESWPAVLAVGLYVCVYVCVCLCVCVYTKLGKYCFGIKPEALQSPKTCRQNIVRLKCHPHPMNTLNEHPTP